jgi:flagellar motor switch protein FliG
MRYDRTDRIRRAAILIASLDDALAEQVLNGLPAEVRERVLDEAERLEAIDPEEQQDVLAEFRRMSRGHRRDAEAVELSFSDAPGSVPGNDGDKFENANASSEPTAAAPTSDGLNEGDAAAMAELLAAEHPQIVAAALARLGEEQSAAVFAALPVDVQAEALDRLADLAPADEAALDEVTAQLQQQMQSRRERQARAAAGAELVQKILARTPTPHRIYLQARMAARETATPVPAAAQPMSGRAAPSRSTAIDPVAQQALNLAAAMRRAQGAGAIESAPLADRSAEFELLSDEALVAGLRSADESTVLRALAASGEGLLARVVGMLPRRQAKQLKRMLANLGPTRLAELHEAQHRLLELAHEADVEEAAA